MTTNSSKSRLQELNEQAEDLPGNLLGFCAFGNLDTCSNNADNALFGRYWCDEHATLVETHKYATFDHTDIQPTDDTHATSCDACNGTGLKRLNDAPAKQDCHWCGGTGKR